MNTRRTHVISVLLVALGLMLSLARPAGAQVTPGALLATQFFGSFAGAQTTYALVPEARLHTPQGDYVGRSGLTEFQSDLEASFSNIQFWAGDAIQAGDLVMVSFTMTGLHTGTWHGLAANCAGISVDGVAMLQTAQLTFSTVDEEQANAPRETAEWTVVVEQWIDYDETALAGQIGGFNQYAPQSQRDCGADQDSGDELPPTSLLPTSRSRNY